jgi:hypothetical protein
LEKSIYNKTKGIPMRHIPWLVRAAAIAVAALASAPSWAETRSFSFANFERVDVAAGTEVILRQGPFSVVAEQRDGNFDRLDIKVRGDTLYVSRKNSWWQFGSGPRYTVTITAPAYEEIDVSSGSSVFGQSLSFGDLRVDVSSGASVDLSGSCASLRLGISSGASFDGAQLQCETARVDASSGASASAFATRDAQAGASSGASVVFHGKPASFDKNTSSGGSARVL